MNVESWRKEVFSSRENLIGDAPARAMLRNCKQFNGKCGCDWCEHEGVTVTPTRYYPELGDQCPRTSQGQAELLQEAVKGVKGISVIDILPTFDTVHGFTPEYMHLVCQGVIRQVCNIWLDSANHEEASTWAEKWKHWMSG